MSEFGLFQENNENNLLQKITGWIVDIFVVIALAMFLVVGMGNVYQITNNSMEPTLSAKDKVLVDSVTVRVTGIQRYDLVEFTLQGTEDTHTSVKRVIGLPGETLQIKDGDLWINGEQMPEESFLGKISIAGVAANPVELGENEFFVIGDNGNSSDDSRFANVGNVRGSQILGRVWFQVSPWDEIGPLS